MTSITQKLWSQAIVEEQDQKIYYSKTRKNNFTIQKNGKKLFFGNISYLLCSDNAFQAPKTFSTSNECFY